MHVEYQKQGAADRRARRHLLVLHVCRRHGTAVTAFGSDRQRRARRARDRDRGQEDRATTAAGVIEASPRRSPLRSALR